jgi:hypothetical protein
MKYKLFFMLVIVLTLLLSACGGVSQTTSTSSSASSQQSTPIPTSPTPTPTLVPKTAGLLLQGLKSQHMPIGESFTYTADNDVNKLLGRPGQYIGKVNFKDTRITDATNTGAAISVRDGGSIETFTNDDLAAKRFKYIQAISQSGAALFAEYEYLEGSTILRISSELTPTQAKAYESALKTVLR